MISSRFLLFCILLNSIIHISADGFKCYQENPGKEQKPPENSVDDQCKSCVKLDGEFKMGLSFDGYAFRCNKDKNCADSDLIKDDCKDIKHSDLLTFDGKECCCESELCNGGMGITANGGMLLMIGILALAFGGIMVAGGTFF